MQRQDELRNNMNELCEITEMNTSYIKNVSEMVSEKDETSSVSESHTYAESISDESGVSGMNGVDLWMTTKTFLETCTDGDIDMDMSIISLGLDSISVTEFIEFVYNQKKITGDRQKEGDRNS